MTFEQIKAVSDRINRVDIKGKAYAQVNDRVMAFREICPEGTIESEIVDLRDGVVVVRAIVRDADDRILATGLAYEREGSTYINKTSYIENCETSAVGRALGFLGIGADGSICSAEELVNAVVNQTPEEMGEKLLKRPTEKQLNYLNKMWKTASDEEKAAVREKFPSFEDITMAQASEIIEMLKK